MVGLPLAGFAIPISRESVSSTTPFASRIFISTRTDPAGAVNDAWSGRLLAGSPTGATAASNSTMPSVAVAVMTTDVARLRVAVASTAGDHVSITSVPESDGVRPDQD